MSTDITMIDLCSIIERYAPTQLRPFASSHGGEYAGMCPWCQGTDRFRVWPNAEKPHYWCRGCLKRGDTIDFMREYCNLSYREACQELGIEPGQEYSVPQKPLQGADDPPAKAWQDMGGLVVERAERFLWTPHGKPALDYLRKRGFTDETIKSARLGYFPTDEQGKWYSRPFADWGLDPELLTPDQQKKGCVRVPDGIIIPWFADNNLWKLTVKRFQASDGELKYGQILGSKDCLFNADSIQSNQPVLLCEAVLDALSAQQIAADQIACVAIDGVKSCQSSGKWIARLAQASHALVAFDNDNTWKEKNKAGDQAVQIWLDVLPRAMRWAPLSHDLNDMLQEKKDIAAWLQMGLSIATTPVAAPAREEPLILSPALQESFTCSVCLLDLNNDLEREAFIDEFGSSYCQSCWERRSASWMLCSECLASVFSLHESGLCHHCWFSSLTTSQPIVATNQQKSFLEYHR